MFVELGAKMVSRLVIAAMLGLALGACGGGGSGSNGSPPAAPPPPPPAGNAAPSLILRTAPQVAHENQVLFFDASGSEDPDGDEFTLTVEQVSGPSAARISESLDLEAAFLAPDIDGTQRVSLAFEIQLEDSEGNVANRTITHTVEGYSGPGQVVAIHSPHINFVWPASRRRPIETPLTPAILATRPTTSSGSEQVNINLVGGVLRRNGTGYRDLNSVGGYEIDATFNSPTWIGYGTLDEAGIGPETQILVAEEGRDNIRYFYAKPREEPYVFEEADSIAIEQPCYLSKRWSTGQDHIIIGQKDRGLSVLRMTLDDDDAVPPTFTENLISTAGQGRSLCFIYRTDLPEPLEERYPGENLNSLIAIDYKTNELVLYTDVGGDAKYDEVGVIKLDTKTDKILNIVDVVYQGGPSSVPRAFYVLLTDGEHGGLHRLIQVRQAERSKEIYQLVYTWERGVPVGMAFGPFSNEDGIYSSMDLVVALGTGEQSLFFKNVTPPTATSGQAPDYAQPVPFDVGPGAGSVVADVGVVGEYGVLISYPETGIVRHFSPWWNDEG